MFVFRVFCSVLCHIWTEYEDLQSKSTYSVRMRENTERKTPNTDTFYAL